MKRGAVKRIFWAFLLGLCLLGGIAVEVWAAEVPAAGKSTDSPGKPETPRVLAIEVKGLRRVDEAAVRERIKQVVGEPVDSDTVSADVREIFSAGYFDDVRVEVEPYEGGLRLIYMLWEKPTLRAVDIFGNEEVIDEDLASAITIRSGSIADPVLIQDNAEKLRAVYERKRFPLAQVVPVLRFISEGHAILTYQIIEGERVRVSQIFIEGNSKVSDRAIRNAMKTTEWWFFSTISGGGKYEKETMDADVLAVRDVYHDQGYITARVMEPEVNIHKDKRYMDITLKVEEGERYTVGKVDFEGNERFTDKEMADKVTLVQGEPVSRKTMREDVETLTDLYSEQGYALATVYPDIRLDEATKVAGITFQTNQGGIYNVGRIDIDGNLKTRDKVIRREVRLDEGERFNGKMLKRSFQMLGNLNYFEDIKIKPAPDPESHTLNISIEVKEKPTGVFNIGGGYSSVDKFVGMIDVTFGNFRGEGQTLKVHSQFSSRSTTYELSFTEPWLFDRPISMTTSVYKTRKEFSEYNQLSTGFSVELSRRFLEYWAAGATYNYEEEEIYNVDDDASQRVKDLSPFSVTSSISPFISRDTRDNFLNPHSGSKNLLSVTYAGLGGDNYFFRGKVDSSWILPVTRQTEFSMRGRYGYATGLNGQKLPPYEHFFVGGAYSVRGLRNLGPKDEDATYLGGTQMVVFNFDYTFPLIKEAGVKGGLFTDMGTAFNDSLHLRKSAGAGIKWVTPLGPLLFYWARNMNPEPYEAAHRWEFAIGSLF